MVNDSPVTLSGQRLYAIKSPRVQEIQVEESSEQIEKKLIINNSPSQINV